MAGTKVSLKLLIDKNANKVIFAEAGKDFVDFLFNLLSLPISTIIRLLTTESMVGCIGNLYKSIENLNETYMQPNQTKDMLLKPRALTTVTNVLLLLPNDAGSSKVLKLYGCSNCYGGTSVSNSPSTKCPSCGSLMSRNMSYIESNSANTGTGSNNEGGYVKGLATYMVTDDLSVTSLSIVSGISVLNKFNVLEFNALEEKVVEFGIDEASFQSKAVLTHVFLVKKEVKNGSVPIDKNIPVSE
ncbi:DUF674 family protein [Quillaja saponaria]|uniref:DUF674 family protein n=1 Tax=Quillaja saponaria TaxID=32244 RepID=A0AAD7Q6Q8_QUISA|nr:DUF674 family protein [Quillaja saponaria]